MASAPPFASLSADMIQRPIGFERDDVAARAPSRWQEDARFFFGCWVVGFVFFYAFV